jgi:hypothetical protein
LPCLWSHPLLPSSSHHHTVTGKRLRSGNDIYFRIRRTTLRIARYLFAAVNSKIERENAFVVRGTSKHLRVAQGTNGVVIAGTPVLLHTGT